MATPKDPWPECFAFQYAESLALARKIAELAQAGIEQGIGGTHNVHDLKRWLKLMRRHAVAIDNHLRFVLTRKATVNRFPNWVLWALERIPTLGEDSLLTLIVGESRRAQALMFNPNPNPEAAEVAIDRAWAASLLVEQMLLAGPPPEPGGEDVFDAARRIVETLEEEL